MIVNGGAGRSMHFLQFPELFYTCDKDRLRSAMKAVADNSNGSRGKREGLASLRRPLVIWHNYSYHKRRHSLV